MTERGPDPMPKTTLGNYKIRAKIGSGGMGDVYDALHTGLNKRVAIKTLRKRFLDDDVVVARFLREGQLASRIRHPNIVDVTDVGMMGGLPCLVMEHLEGESFSAMIRRDGRLQIGTIVDILLPIVAAVDFAHDHGVMHRDLKPSNLFLSRSWNGEIVPKVLDFGISKLVHDSADAGLTTDSAFVGTPHYASPELMRADKMADGRSDQYSMGVILYEAVTGIRPFADLGNNFVALAMAVVKGEFTPVRTRNPEIPAAFEQIIERAMSLKPEDRFLTMRAVGEALLPFAGERERLIWGPTFRGQSGVSHAAASEAPLHPSPSAIAAATIATGAPFSGGSTALGPPRPLQPSGPPTPRSYPSSHPSSHPFSSGPPPGFGEHISAHPSGTPPGAAFDRLPSYGASSAPMVRPRGSGVVTAVVGVSIGVAILASVILLRTGHRPDDTKSATSASAPEATFAIDFQATPETAAIELDGVAAGAGRLSRTFTRDGHKHVLRLSAPGYESLLLEFDETRPPPSSIALRAMSPAGLGPGTPTTGGGGPHRIPSGPPPGKVKGSSDGRPKTDNINPWE